MNKKYLDPDGKLWNGKNIILNDMMIINPTEEQLLEAGYTEYVEPAPAEPTEEELLERAKQEKLWQIEDYDRSDAVNSFTIGEQQMWLTVQERQQIATQISANEAVGRENMTKWFNGQSFTFSIDVWKQMLLAVEIYAGDALNVTESHKAAVNALTTKEEVEEYDYTTGYPQKLVF